MRTLSPTIPLLAAALTALLATSALGATYVGGATFVARDDGLGQLLDAGGVLCYEGTGDGVGGACLSWDDVGTDAFVSVDDVLAGTNVAFQVCVDNNGDGLCGGGFSGGDGILAGGKCSDTILFSHDDEGAFFNPLGPMPTAFPSGCSGGYEGWIVFLCEGVHDDGSSSHEHPATSGRVTSSPTGTGTGTFCGGVRELNVPPKPYVVAPGDATPQEVDDLVTDALAALEAFLAQAADAVEAFADPDVELGSLPSVP